MLNDADAELSRRLIERGIANRDATPAYLQELRGNYKGLGHTVALPADTAQVSDIIRLCAEKRVGVIPYGGGTGLVAGQVAPEGPVPLILSLEKMSAIRAVRAEEGTLDAEAGATIADIQRAAEAAGLLFPLSYGAQESARIGGALAVNSGGINVLRYGMTRDLCLGLEAVLPSGEILHGLKRLRKDNTGYDLRHLLIGSEGTLGVITAAALRLVARPARLATAFLAVEDPAAALTLLSLFRDQAAESISSFELLSGQSYAFLGATCPEVRLPFETAPEWSVLVELGTGPSLDPEAVLAETFEAALERGLVHDGRIAQSGQQRADFWQVREMIPEANRRIGAIASHDIALPLSEVAGYIAEATPALRALLPCRINVFGHLGDGNLHFNVFPPSGEGRDAYRHRTAEVTRLVHDMCVARGGTFSAEHGIGRAKAADLQRYGDPAKLAAMRAIKAALDPLGIMNPGAVLLTG
jgi:FAD/FMN-containing dehydrogenase